MLNHRFEMVDGLRGVAVILILIYHLGQWTGHQGLVPHGYLGIDLMFMISGFVIAHVYGTEMGRTLDLLGFLRRRLIRIWPLMVLSVVLGALYQGVQWYFTGNPPLDQVLAAASLGALLLPWPAWAPSFSDSPFPLNGPMWSLFFGLAVNFIWACFATRLGWRTLTLLLGMISATLIGLTLRNGGIDFSSGGQTEPLNLWLALARAAFGIFVGLALHRVYLSGRLAFTVPAPASAVALVLLLIAPRGDLNLIYDLMVTMLALPTVLAVAVSALPGRAQKTLCRVGGELAYPVYILHVPLYFMISRSLLALGGDNTLITNLSVGVVVCAIAWLIHKLFDEPARAWMRRLLPVPARA